MKPGEKAGFLVVLTFQNAANPVKMQDQWWLGAENLGNSRVYG
jgi:hypothetical protein